MPDFFVPAAENREQAERVYRAFQQANQYEPASGRLFRISFADRGKSVIAEVGKELDGFGDGVGPVLAIIESRQLVTIHTQLRGGLSASPILVSPAKVEERIYFDEFPALP